MCPSRAPCVSEWSSLRRPPLLVEEEAEERTGRLAGLPERTVVLASGTGLGATSIFPSGKMSGERSRAVVLAVGGAALALMRLAWLRRLTMTVRP